MNGFLSWQLILYEWLKSLNRLLKFITQAVCSFAVVVVDFSKMLIGHNRSSVLHVLCHDTRGPKDSSQGKFPPVLSIQVGDIANQSHY